MNFKRRAIDPDAGNLPTIEAPGFVRDEASSADLDVLRSIDPDAGGMLSDSDLREIHRQNRARRFRQL